MALGHSPQTVTNGLMFYYDMGNPQKSWKGAPTTNAIQTNLNLYDKDNGCTVTQLPETFEGNPIYRVVFPAGTLPRIRTTFAYTAGQQYTGSIYYKVVSQGSHTPQLIFRENGFGTTYASVSLTGASWQRTNITHTFSGSGTSMFLLYQSSSAATTPTTIDFSMPQTELQPFATPFVNGARSNTQAILDLTNNNTVTANSLTYNADGSFGFNGTNNEMHPPINHSYLSSSALEVIFRSTSHGAGYKTIFGYRHNSGFSLPTIGSLYLNSNNLSASVIAASQVYRTATSSVSIATNTFYHVVLNKNTSTGLLEIYVNGLLTGSQTFDAATYGQWTAVGQFIGADILDIGKSTNTNSGQGWATDFFNGIIPVAKVYNRVLTAAEVQQNFNALRGRYGL